MKMNKKGLTLTEVIVSFTLLMVGMGIFSQAVLMSVKLTQKADYMIEQAAMDVDSYYLKNQGSEEISVEVKMRIGSGAPNSSVGKVGITEKKIYYYKSMDSERGGIQ